MPQTLKNRSRYASSILHLRGVTMASIMRSMIWHAFLLSSKKIIDIDCYRVSPIPTFLLTRFLLFFLLSSKRGCGEWKKHPRTNSLPSKKWCFPSPESPNFQGSIFRGDVVDEVWWWPAFPMARSSAITSSIPPRLDGGGWNMGKVWLLWNEMVLCMRMYDNYMICILYIVWWYVLSVYNLYTLIICSLCFVLSRLVSFC